MFYRRNIEKVRKSGAMMKWWNENVEGIVRSELKIKRMRIILNFGTSLTMKSVRPQFWNYDVT